MKADKGNPADVVVEGTCALSLQDDLLLNGLENILKAFDGQNSFFNDSRLSSFFS
jgi:hypothetical protein